VKPDHRWLCLVVTVSRSDSDRAIQLLWDLGTVGIQEEDLPSSAGSLTLKAFFPADRTQQTLLEDFRRVSRDCFTAAVSASVSETVSNPDDWIEDYKKNFHGFSIGRSFYIHPSWEAPSRDHRINLVIDPGHAFGTGTHESTQLCLLALENLDIPPRTVLDVGTGSGILAMAAHRLVPGLRVTAVDNDPQAIEMCQENFRRNALEDINLVVASPDAIRGRFDLILANLTEPIFRQVSGELARLGSQLVVSGFTEEQAHLVIEYFNAHGLQPTGRWESGGWCCLRLGKSRKTGLSTKDTKGHE